jgi:hypothetical protein
MIARTSKAKERHMADVVELPGTESDYRAWLREHPHGFVLNAWREPADKPESTKGVMWHRADCEHLISDGPERYVSGDTLKACSLDLATLTLWAVERGEPLYFCKDSREKRLSKPR